MTICHLLTLLKRHGNNKNHRIEFYGLILSFAGWFILSIFTAGLLMIWLMPYMNVSLANLYRRLTKETKFEDSSEGLSNGAIIGIIAILYVLFFASIIIILINYAIPQIEKKREKKSKYMMILTITMTMITIMTTP